MSYTRGTSTITQQNLVYHLDIPNPLCYHTTKCYSLVSNITGNIINNITYSSDANGSLEFNGTNHYMDLNESLSFINEQSMEVWIKPDGTGYNYQRIIDKSEGNDALNGYALIYHPILNMIYYIVNNNTSKDMIGYKLPTSNQWVNIVVTKNNSIYKIYVNGELCSQNTGTINFSLTSTNLRIGAYTQSQERNFKGKINNIKIYNKALIQEEVLINYEALKRRFIN